MVLACFFCISNAASAQPTLTTIRTDGLISVTPDGLGIMGSKSLPPSGGLPSRNCPFYMETPAYDGTTSVPCSDYPSTWRFAFIRQTANIGSAALNYIAMDGTLGSALLHVDWQNGGPSTVEDLGPPPPGFNYGGVFGVSMQGTNRRAVATLYSNDGSQAFYWRTVGRFFSLGSLPPGWTQTTASGISHDGALIIGNAIINGVSRPYRWDDGGRFADLGNLPPGWSDMESSGVSGDGRYIVGSATTPSGTNAAYWEPAALYHDDGRFGGAHSTYLAANGDGSIRVGRSSIPHGNASYTPIIFTPEYGLRSLPQLLRSWRQPGMDQWEMDTATGISADGTVVVGYGWQGLPRVRSSFVVRVPNWCRPGFLSEPDDVFPCPSGTANFSVVIDGPRNPVVQWQWLERSTLTWFDCAEGQNTDSASVVRFIATGTNSSSLSLTSADGPSGELLVIDSIRAIVSNSCGSVTSRTVTLWNSSCCIVTCDINEDGGADTSDVLDLADVIAGGTPDFPTSCRDFNQDGSGDTNDVIDLTDAIATGTCPQ